MWSIGVTCYLLLCGDTPFNGKNRQQLFRRISCDEPTFPDDKWGHISDEAVEFVRKMLTKDPAKRFSAIEALQHRWLTEGNSMMAQQQQPHPQPQAEVPMSGGKSSEDVLQRRQQSSRSRSSRSSSQGRRKSPNKTPASPTPNRLPSTSPAPTSRVRKSNRSVSRDSTRVRTSNRSISRDSTRVRTSNRSASRESTRSSRQRATPPPPPKPQAPRESPNHLAKQMNSSGTSTDENSRLLDVIKNQDAKIEKLERMVKRMLEPEGAVHEC